jgi:hypothetical protein
MSSKGQSAVLTIAQRLQKRALEQKKNVIPESEDEDEKSVHSEEKNDEDSGNDNASSNGESSGEEEEEPKVKKSESKKREREPSSTKKTGTTSSKKTKKPKPKEFLDSLTSGILNHVSNAAAVIESPVGSDDPLQIVLFNDVKDVDNVQHIRRLIQCKTLLSSAMNFIQPYIEKIEKDMPEESKNYMRDMRTKFTNVCNATKRLEEDKVKKPEAQGKKEN